MPLIVVRQRRDQHLVGARVAVIGVGLRVPPHEATPARLREPVSTVLSDPAFRANAAKLGTTIKWAGDHRRAADKVARFAGA